MDEFWLAIGLAADAGLLAIALRECYRDYCKRVGGITFWRIGRVGGSFYVARKTAQ